MDRILPTTVPHRCTAQQALEDHARFGVPILKRQIICPPERTRQKRAFTEAARAAARPKVRIGVFFVQRGLITDVQLRHALTQQAILKRRGQKLLLGDLVRYGYVQREQLRRALREWEQAASPR